MASPGRADSEPDLFSRTAVEPPEIRLDLAAPLAVDGVDVVAVPVGRGGSGPLLDSGAARMAEAVGLDALALLRHHGATGAAGEVLSHPVLRRIEGAPDSLREVLLVGVGDGDRTGMRRAGATVARATSHRASVAWATLDDDPEAVESFVVGATLGAFGFGLHRDDPARRPPRSLAVAVGDLRPPVADADRLAQRLGRAVELGRALGGAAWRARLLATIPSNLKDPAWMAAQAEQLAREAGLGFKVWDEHDLYAAGFGGLVGVGQASPSPPRLIRLDYTPARTTRRTPHVVLVGKGVTFDTGGLSLKPHEAMKTMKRDMTGGGVVMAVLAALPQVGCRVRVTGLVPAVENSIGPDALRPGDVIRHFGGRTTEVTNTDAEGRLILADAMAYAVAELRPDVLVDIATLTGGMRVALGQRMGGVFANDDALAAALLEAGRTSGEPLWRFPLAADYEDKLASKVADADNGAGNPGAITAALFLQHFAGDVPWAHLDVASAGDWPADGFEWNEGPSGYGARALLDWLRLEDPLAGVAR